MDNVNNRTQHNSIDNDDDDNGEDIGYETSDCDTNESDDEDDLSGNFIDHDNILRE